MSFIPSRLATRRKLAWLLAGGFALVILLLIGASYAAVRSSRSVRESAASLASEQVLATQLISELQLEQAALNTLSHQFTHSEGNVDRRQLTATLRQIDDLLARLLNNRRTLSDQEVQADLQQSARDFSASAQRILDTDDSSPDALEELFAAHDRVLQDVALLMEASTRRTSAAEARIAAYTDEGLSESLLLLGLALTLSVTCAIITARAVTHLVTQMREQESELSRVSWHMQENQEAALRRFSHELHDDLGQSLAAVRAMVENLTPETLRVKQKECLEVVDDSITNVRELSQLLRPVILDDFGLDASLRWLGERFSERTNIAWNYRSNFDGRLPDDIETHLFRITQEALTNVARHSRANAIQVELRDEGDRIRLRIADNGRGFPGTRQDQPPPNPDDPPRLGLGLIGMRARAARVGGEVQILSPAAGGVTVQVIVPVKRVDDTA
ncbi:MAG: sensor histidine kinase [Bryobacterales bacterium]